MTLDTRGKVENMVHCDYGFINVRQIVITDNEKGETKFR